MNPSPARLSVLAGKEFVCIKIAGRANFNTSIDFRTVVNELKGRGYSFFVLDLTECMLMDSTFLGALAGFGLKFNSNIPGQDGRQIELYRPNARISELLENLGVLHLFRVTEGELSLGDTTEVPAAESCPANKEEVTRACLEAHRTLMEINPGNVARFKDVAQFLAEDLKKMKAAGA